MLPYETYRELDFLIPVGGVGDSYDRLILRVREMRESINIIGQSIASLPSGFIKTRDFKFVSPERDTMQTSMESLIHHFRIYSEGISVPAGEIYTAIESPKGEFGVFLASSEDVPNKPYRCKIHSPGFFHLQGLNHLVKNSFLADVVAVIGTLDIVFGEVDR
jgi:NADH:ubiquinone oxidoreductase subunit D